ncbi:MAG: MFS transporter [Proteobacteria bacterium]|nr:MFS transporter [Pseudomonadota bacterium]
MNANERRILVVTCFGHFSSHFNMLVFPAIVLPLAGRLGLDLGSALALSFAQYLLFGLTALPWGLAADRWGGRPFLVLFFLGAGGSALAAALWIDQPSRLALALAGLGLFSGIYHPVGLGMISKSVRRMSLALGYNGMAGNLGLALAPLAAGLVNWRWGPAAAYLVVAALNLAGLVPLLLMGSPENTTVSVESGSNGGQGAAPFLVLLMAMMLGGVAYRGATLILPAFFELRGQGLYQALAAVWPAGPSGNLVATALTSIIFLVGILGQFAGGRAGERYEARSGYLVFHLLTLPPVFLISLAGDLTVAGMGLVYCFFLLGMQPLENTLVARLTPGRFRHAAFGAKFVLTFGVGSLAVKLVGWIERGWGLTAVFPALGLVSLLLVLSILVLIKVSEPVLPAPGPARS